MSGMNHAFWLVRAADHPPARYRPLLSLPPEVEIHDDLIRYMNDALRWIPAQDPRRGEPCAGLDLYGPTCVHTDGARVARAVFSAWAALYALGPEMLDLTGPSTRTADDPSAGTPERLRLDRDDVCSRLNRLAELCERVSSSGGELYLLHFGI